jgi:hypothetical protein
MEYINNAVSLGLGYLVYKGIMTELAKAPVKEGVKVTSEGLLGFKDVTPLELRQAITGTESGLFQDIFNPRKAVGYTDPYQDWLRAGGVPKPAEKIKFEEWSLGGSLLPEGFELVGPSRTGITRPKGLD